MWVGEQLRRSMKDQWVKEEVLRRAFPGKVDVTEPNGFIWIKTGNGFQSECDVCKFSLRETSQDLEWPCASRNKCIKENTLRRMTGKPL